MHSKEIGNTLYEAVKDFSGIMDKVLHTIILPLLPLYTCGTFADMTKSGKTFAMIKSQIPGYITALGTQSSAAWY